MNASFSQLGLPFLAAIAAASLMLVSGIVVVFRSSKSLAIRDGVFFGLAVLTGVLWVFAFLPALLSEKPVAQTAGASTAKVGACVSIHSGMKAAEVVQMLGEPASKASEEDIWGPGATRWTYSESSCRVHLLGDAVHLVD